jgi:hypothetical protein
VGVAAVLLVCLLAAWLVSQHTESRRRALLADVADYERQIKELAKDTTALKEIEKWRAGDPVWLEEFRWLVKRLPGATETMLERLTMSTTRRGPEIASQITFEGFARTRETLETLQKPLRDGHRQVDLKNPVAEKKQPGYTYHYTTSVLIPREVKP